MRPSDDDFDHYCDDDALTVIKQKSGGGGGGVFYCCCCFRRKKRVVREARKRGERLLSSAFESSFWILPTADHYPQRDRPEEVAKIVSMALTGQVPTRESESEFMRRYAASRSVDDAVYVGRSRIEALDFPSSIEYTPSGYRTARNRR